MMKSALEEGACYNMVPGNSVIEREILLHAWGRGQVFTGFGWEARR